MSHSTLPSLTPKKLEILGCYHLYTYCNKKLTTTKLLEETPRDPYK